MAEQIALHAPIPIQTETAVAYLGCALRKLTALPLGQVERRMPRDEVARRLQAILSNERCHDPDYGDWPTDKNMWAGDVMSAQDLLDYLICETGITYPLKAHPPIDNLTMSIIGLGEEDIKGVLDHQVIKPTGEETGQAGDTYYLYKNYGNYWFRQVVENL